MKKRILSLVLCAAMLLSMCLFLGAGVTEATSDTAADTTESASAPRAVNFTNVAPFGPAVTGVSPLRARSVTPLVLDGNTTDSDNGLVTSKTAKANPDGSYTITLEAYTTGTVTTETKDVPTDIVLVLDQSGSMAEAFGDGISVKNADTTKGQQEGYYIYKSGGQYYPMRYNQGKWQYYDYDYYYYGYRWLDFRNLHQDDIIYVSRLGALKDALNNFTAAVRTKALGTDGKVGTEDDVDHRIAMVGFASSGNDYNGVRYENTELLIGSKQYGYTSASKYYANAFQDMRTTKGQNNVVASINALDAYGGTFTNLGVEMANGIFNANQVQSGEQRNRVMVVFTDGLPGTGNYNSSVANSAISQAQTAKNSGVTVYSVGIFSGADATSAGNQNGSETEKANYFMQNVSSNNGTPQNPSYYLSAGDSDSLNSIFKQISNQISNPSINLGSETVVKDVVTPYFTVPANASQVTVTSVACTGFTGGKPTWDTENAQTLSNAVTINDSTIEVTGFDFDHNFVAENGRDENDATKAGKFHGRKLVISFTVKPKDGFLGGNNVYTNDNAAIYESSTAQTPVVTFKERPQVNVRIKPVTVTAQEKNVYLLGNLTANQLRSGATVKVGDVSLDLTRDDYGLEAWQTAYVDIEVTITDKAGKDVSTDGLSSLKDDTTYTVTVTVSPKTEATETANKGAAAKEQTGRSNKANVNVYKPVLTYKDSEVYYGEAVPSSFEENRTLTEWKHGETEAPASMGPAPTLTMIYTPETDKIANDKINTRQDVGVDVTVKIDETDVTDKASFVHTNCEETTCKVPKDCEFVLHVKTCSLTIYKTVNGKGWDKNQTFVFDVKDSGGNVVTTVVLKDGDSKKITGLPVGSYTVTEDTNWSWSFKADNAKQTVTLGRANTETNVKPTATVSVVNTFTQPNWLTSIADVINKWETKDGTAAITPIWPKN